MRLRVAEQEQKVVGVCPIEIYRSKWGENSNTTDIADTLNRVFTEVGPKLANVINKPKNVPLKELLSNNGTMWKMRVSGDGIRIVWKTYLIKEDCLSCPIL